MSFEKDIRYAARCVLDLACRGECFDKCEYCTGAPKQRVVSLIKGYWFDHREYPTSETIRDVLAVMEAEGEIVAYVDADNLQAWRWHHTEPMYLTRPEPDEDGDDTMDNPAYVGEDFGDMDWRPPGERLKQDKRGYSPRQTIKEVEAFYADKESLPRYDQETRTYVREDLPRFFECGCSRNKVLLGKCDVYGRDGRERDWRQTQGVPHGTP